jgi:hypothetical protein
MNKNYFLLRDMSWHSPDSLIQVFYDDNLNAWICDFIMIYDSIK